MLELAKSTFTIRRQYPRPLIKKLWIAFRAEWIKAGLSREKFSDYLADTIYQVHQTQNATVQYPDGSPFVIADTLPRPETFENFVKLGAMYAGNHPKDDSLIYSRVSTRTLQYIHLFLWHLDPSRISTWDEPSTECGFDHIVGYLDESFEPILPTDVLPTRIKLFEIPERGYTRGLARFTQDPSVNLVEQGWNFYGFLIFKALENNTRCNARFIDASLWQEFQTDMHNLNHKTRNVIFRKWATSVPIGSVTIKNKGLDIGDGYCLIDTDFHHVIIKEHDNLRDRQVVECFKVDLHRIKEFFTSKKIMEGMMTKFLHVKEDTSLPLMAFPVVNELENKLIDVICN